MSFEKFRYLAAVIFAHPNQRVAYRKRIQKTIKLLQRLDFPTDYDYKTFFYGPYSEALHLDLRLLQGFKLIEEEEHHYFGSSYFIIKATSKCQDLPDISKFQSFIKIMAQSRLSVLELAATYDSYREMGSDHKDALKRLKMKKGPKCTPNNLQETFDLLFELNLLSKKEISKK